MPIPYVLGARVALPSQIGPYVPQPGDPATRPLWIYASDPASVGLRQQTMRVDVPYERLQPGPIGTLFAVEHGALPDRLCKLLDWSKARIDRYALDPLDLDHYAISAGLAPTTGDPRFAGQMAYAVCCQVYETFRRALGRYPSWGLWAAERIASGAAPVLRLRTAACCESNAYYDPH